MEFIETFAFSKAARDLISDEELSHLQITLLSCPGMGAIIPGSGGLRKLRWIGGAKGKRGGLRVIYYWVTAEHQIYLLYVYKKSKQENLTPEQIRQLKVLLED